MAWEVRLRLFEGEDGRVGVGGVGCLFMLVGLGGGEGATGMATGI